jgi:nucleoside-diphosphate-sugar epimerase
MRVALTGGDGAVGRSLQKALRMRAVDFRSLVPSEPPLEMARMGEYVIGAESDAAAVERLLDGVTVLVHLGRSSLPVSDDFCQEELFGQATLIPAARERSIEVHFLSANEVFSPPSEPAARLFTEEDPVEPSTPLGVAKVAWEQTLRIWGEHKGLRFVIYRVPLVVPEYLSYSNVMARYLRNGYREGVITPRARENDRWGTCYVHAEDVANVIADGFGRDDVMGETFHVASDQGIREYDLAEMSFNILRDFMILCKWNPLPPEKELSELIGNVWLDNSKAKQTFHVDLSGSVARLAAKLRLWIDDFGSTARLPVAT